MKSNIIIILITFVSIFSFAHMTEAALNDWAEGGYDQQDGATRDYFNRGGRLLWKNYMGDWLDAENAEQGPIAYTETIISDTDSTKRVEWNLTGLVQDWLNETIQNYGIFLHATDGSGPYYFRSREYNDPDQRPKLEMILLDGTIVEVDPEADTYTESSTYRSLGKDEKLRINTGTNGNNILIRFSLDSYSGQTITNARLILTTYAQYGSNTITIGAFRSDQGLEGQSVPKQGIAGCFYYDTGIMNNDDVIFATGFEDTSWQDDWSFVNHNLDIVDSDPGRNFLSFSGKALRAWLAENSNYGSSMGYKFQEKTGQEPEEIYFRYYLRLGSNWNQTVYCGKMPGISGTYGKAGWGGRKPDGTDGWSARGSFGLTIPQDNNPLGGRTPMGTYCYYADQPGSYGDIWYWNQGYHAFLLTEKWYCIEQYLKMNSSGNHDGIIKVWIDGHQVFFKNDIMFRTVDTLKIEQIWLNLYHGGTAVSPYDQHMYIDNVVLAKSYIGPVGMGSNHDFDHDCDVDGMDLAQGIQSGMVEWESFASEYGKQ